MIKAFCYATSSPMNRRGVNAGGSASSSDVVLSTIPERHDVHRCVGLLKRGKTRTEFGVLELLAPENDMEEAMHWTSALSSLIGNRADAQRNPNFCAEHNIGRGNKAIAIHDISVSSEKAEKGDVRFRYVIAMASIQHDLAA